MDYQTIVDRGFIIQAEQDEVMTDDNFRKIRLVDPDGEAEGIWCALLRSEDRDVYDDDDNRGTEIKVALSNHALCFMPNRSWGMVITAVTDGGNRPVAKSEWLVENLNRVYEAYVKEWGPSEFDNDPLESSAVH